MNGPHDLGGQMGFGPVVPEPNEPVFHVEWERRAIGMNLCSRAFRRWGIDESRHAQETLHPVDYLSSSYYEKWMKGLEVLLVRHGLLTTEELKQGRGLTGVLEPIQPLAASDVAAMLAKGSPYDRPITEPARFTAGQTVRTINDHPTGHTRLPRYARGKLGRIESVHGGFVFPDTNAHGKGEQPQRLYTVVFAGPELWGRSCDPTLTVSIDAWESYLEPV